jgi:tellurite resistance protein
MHNQERRGILTLCLMAAFADGERSEEEREHLRQVARHLGEAAGPDLLQRVLQRQVTVRDAARVLTTTEARSLAYEMAVCVCDADGRLNAQERSFLREVQQALNVGEAPAATTQREAEALIVDGLEDLPGPAGAAAPTADTSTGMSAPAPGAARAEPGGAPATAAAAGGVIDSMVLKYAILNGALELLPQPIATMAIIPLQMKMVYRIGGVYGYALDRGHVREFLGVVGVGMTSQVVETFARRLLTGFAKQVLGKM